MITMDLSAPPSVQRALVRRQLYDARRRELLSARFFGRQHRAVCVSAGGDELAHTVVCTEHHGTGASSNVYSFGSGDSGRLGHGGDEDEPVPRPVRALGMEKALKVSCGEYHNIICTAQGSVWTWGSGFGVFTLTRPTQLFP